MSIILFHGSQESLEHITDRLKHHRLRRGPLIKDKGLAPRALIVDDDVESIQPLQIVLKNYGFETTLAFDGREALSEIEKKSFDIAFMDICMPEMTGLEVLERIEFLQQHDRKHFKRNHPLPVVTYSSYDMAGFEIPDGQSFYFADHWQKPISLGDLASLTGHTLDQLGIVKSRKG